MIRIVTLLCAGVAAAASATMLTQAELKRRNQRRRERAQADARTRIALVDMAKPEGAAHQAARQPARHDVKTTAGN